MQTTSLKIAMLSVHSSPLGPLGTRDTGGMSVYIRETARELGRMGHRVDIFTRRTAGVGDPVIALDENVRLVYLNTGNGSNASPAYSGFPQGTGILSKASFSRL